MPFAVIFPGQGAATPGAGHPWTDHPAWSVVADAEAATRLELARLLLDADEAELSTTRASQLAVLLGSLVAWDALSAELDEQPVAFAGHSLGQITALIAAGAIDRADGFRLAARRAGHRPRPGTGRRAPRPGATRRCGRPRRRPAAQ